MSLKKPIIKVTRKCISCRATGNAYDYNSMESGYEHRCPQKSCSSCNGNGRIDLEQNDPRFKKYYIKNLEEVIEYWTKEYRIKNKEAQEYLAKVKEYSKELDKIINK